jgi:hypothetical protein
MFVGVLAFVPARAWADDSMLDALGKAAGVVAPPVDPPDFVKASRPSEEPSAIPVFSTPEEPRSKVKSPADLKAMDADLERASRRQRARGSGSDGAGPAPINRRAGKTRHKAKAQP